MWIKVTNLATEYSAIDIMPQGQIMYDPRQLVHTAYTYKSSAQNVRYTMTGSQNFLQNKSHALDGTSLLTMLKLFLLSQT